ncbi:MAG: hypothetical protein Ta2A_05550 [Treponemataceae bacterium]|nr:MAG: hypothetical protein Ta2A_05550 [Treponemataceae bacterium]
MKNKMTPELLISDLCNSEKTKKMVIAVLAALTVICIIPLLPAVQNVLFSFVGERVSQKSKLLSLLSLPFAGVLMFLFFLACLSSKKIASYFDTAKNEKVISIVSVAVTLFMLGFVTVFSYRHGHQWLDSDHSSEMVLGKLLAAENNFVSPNWHYSTELRVIYQTIFMMPLFKIFGALENWALIRALTILLNNIVLLLSYIFMMKGFKVARKWIFFTMVFLVLPVSGGYWSIVTFGGYYIFFIAQLFCCLGLFVRLLNAGSSHKFPAIVFALFTMLSLVLGVQGIRSPLTIQIPLFLACVYFSVTVEKQRQKWCIFLGTYSLFLCIIGFAINYLLHFKYSFHSFENMLVDNLFSTFLAKLGECIICFASFFGLSSDNSLLSARGILSVFALIGAGIFFYSASKALRKEYRTQSNPCFLVLFFIISCLFNVFVFIVVNESVTARYFIPFMVLYIPLLAHTFENAEQKQNPLNRTAVIAAVILFLAGQSFLNFQSLARQNNTETRNGYIRYLLDNKLDYGFATFWNANVTTELTNGRIELAGIEPDGLKPGANNFRIQGWLNPNRFYTSEYHDGASFLLLTRPEWDMAKSTEREFAQNTPDYEDDNFIILRFASDDIIYSDVLDK